MDSVLDLEKLIKARGLRSRTTVAKELGVTRQQIFLYEKGKSEPPLSVVSKMAKLYGVKISDLLNENFLPTLLN